MANNLPLIEATANVGFARPAAANTASDGSGTIPTLFTAASGGSYLYRVRIMNSQATAAASSAMVARLFITDTAGASPRLLAEAVLPAATRTAAVVGSSIIITFSGRGLFLASGQLIKCCQSVYASAADQVDFVAEGGDL